MIDLFRILFAAAACLRFWVFGRECLHWISLYLNSMSMVYGRTLIPMISNIELPLAVYSFSNHSKHYHFGIICHLIWIFCCKFLFRGAVLYFLVFDGPLLCHRCLINHCYKLLVIPLVGFDLFDNFCFHLILNIYLTSLYYFIHFQLDFFMTWYDVYLYCLLVSLQGCFLMCCQYFIYYLSYLF